MARCLSFTKAAKGLFISQSNISRQIASLEEELGLALFDRNTKGVKLTIQGQMLAETLSEMVGEWNVVLTRAKNSVKKFNGCITVGCQEHIKSNSYISQVLSGFRENRPEIQIIKDKALDEIKEAVFKYGGVQSSIYSTLNNIYSRSDYYNSKTSSYCYIGTKKPNHEIVIIGWDDEYPKENFNVKLEGDGAFICQNSWGKLFGDDGVFYVSYYDSNIGMQNLVYTSIEDTDNYDEIYQTDLCGWVGQIGYGSDTSYAANVYEARDDEIIEAVGLYATGIDTEYEIYIVEDFKDKKSLEMTSENMVASGTIRNKGYYTIPVDGVEVNQGNKFAIICKLTVPNSVHPIAIEYKAGELTDNVDLSDGEGYISHRGRDWVRTEEVQKCNVCLKAYTKRIDK